MKNILLVTDGFFHPPLHGRRQLHRFLHSLPGYTFQHINSLEKLPGLNPQDFQGMMLYFHHKTISPAALQTLEAFVKQGTGLIGLHSVTASFKRSNLYFEILGGRLCGHGAVSTFDVQPVGEENAPFTGLAGFRLRDELYLHELQSGVQVHFQSLYQGQGVPVVWTYRYGDGKVCYAAPGHTTRSMEHPGVQAILQRGLAWVSS